MSAAIYGTLLHVETRTLDTVYGPFAARVYRNLASGGYALALAYGDVGGGAPILARIHSSCVTSEVFGSCDCDCVEQLDAAVAAIARAGRGVVFYLMQEGRGAGFTAKVRDRMIVQASGERTTTFEAYQQMGLARDLRSYEEVVFAGRLLGITAPLTVLTSNAEKVGELVRAGVAIAGTVPLTHAASAYNLHYLRAKRPPGADGGDVRPARLPEPVRCVTPTAVADVPGIVHTASYLLPIAPRSHGDAPAAGPHWFRLHAYVDIAAGSEWVVLAYGRVDHGVPLVRAQPAPLLERFPLAGGGVWAPRWRATTKAFVGHGSGCAIFRVAERDATRRSPHAAGPTAARLLANHLPARRARLVLDAPEPSPAEGALAEALGECGVRLDPPCVLTVGDEDAG